MEENNILPQEATVMVVDIQFRPGQKIYYFDPNGIACKAGDHVIIDTARGPEFGICTGGNHTISNREVVAPLRPVLRLANAQDEKILADNRAKEKQAYETCLKKIAQHGLDMQLRRQQDPVLLHRGRAGGLPGAGQGPGGTVPYPHRAAADRRS